MNTKLLYNILKLLAFVPLLLTMAPVMAQDDDVVYTGETTVFAVEEAEGMTYTWYLYNDVEGLNLAETEGNCPQSEAYFVGGVNTEASVEVMWLSAGTYFYKVVAEDDCSNNLKLGIIEVEESLPTAFFEDPEDVCVDDPAEMTLVLSGTEPWSVTYTVEFEGEIIETETLTGIAETPHTFTVTHGEVGIYTYTVISVTDENGTNEEPSDPVFLEVLPRPVTSPIEWYDPLSGKE